MKKDPLLARVHPELRAAFAQMPALDLFSDINGTRKMNEEMFKNMPVDESVPISTQAIPTLDGTTKIPLRIYRPQKQTEKLPGLLYIHGGGYVLGFAAMSDPLCQKIVRDVNCIVVSVDYRLAPEYPFPAGLEDCYAALLWMADPQNSLDIDTEKLAVAGASAGGGLTAALTLMVRDKGGPALTCQLPLCPMLDDRNLTPSSHEFTDARLWNRETNLKAWQMYLGENRQEVPPYAAPARAKDLSGLPPTYTYVGELDLFRDETIDYVTRLMQAGVSTEFHIYPGCFHGFENFVPQAEISKRATEEFILYLKNAFWPSV
ncbi:MAG: alpha/beta hydrolase [Firmicutes bacterium]|nr:alpha/beta hydrolase [Bacillota bacterium]